MTITTAKLARAVSLACARPLAVPLALSALLLAPAARALDLDLDGVQKRLNGIDVVKPSANSWRIVPTLDVRQIFTDNINLAPSDRAHSQFLTDVSPGVTVSHKGRRLLVDGIYQMHLYANAHDEYGTRRSSTNMRANAKAELIDDMLFIDGNASIFNQSISPFAQLVSDNDYASSNRARVRTWQVSPYLINRFGRLARSEVRYRHDSVNTGRTGLGNSDGDTLSFRLNNGVHWDDLSWGLSASQQEIRSQVSNDSTIRLASANMGYQLLPTFQVNAAVLYDDYDYESVGGANGGRGWNTGVRWTPSRRTSVAAGIGKRFYGPSRMLSAQHRTRRTAWNLSFDDAVITSRANFLLPRNGLPVTGNPGDPAPADLGDGLFNPGIPDPNLPPVRPPVVLPPGFTDNLNFFSNRFSLQKQLRATMTLRGGRSAAVTSLFKVRREALSVRTDDTDVLGSPVDSINDNIIQTGITTALTYRLTPRSNLTLTGNVIDNESITTGFKARSNAIRLNLSHQLGRNISSNAELRRVSGATGVTDGARYTENAVSVSLNMTL